VQAAGLPPFSYQWFFGSLPIDGATSDVLTFSSVDFTNAGTYRVVVTNAYRSVVSDTATLTVVAAAGGGPRLWLAVTDGRLELSCEGTVGRVHHLQVTTQLGAAAEWQTVASGTMPAARPLKWTRPVPESGSVYFRVTTEELNGGGKAQKTSPDRGAFAAAIRRVSWRL
jgi:hypothetical protein